MGASKWQGHTSSLALDRAISSISAFSARDDAGYAGKGCDAFHIHIGHDRYPGRSSRSMRHGDEADRQENIGYFHEAGIAFVIDDFKFSESIKSLQSYFSSNFI